MTKGIVGYYILHSEIRVMSKFFFINIIHALVILKYNSCSSSNIKKYINSDECNFVNCKCFADKMPSLFVALFCSSKLKLKRVQKTARFRSALIKVY